MKASVGIAMLILFFGPVISPGWAGLRIGDDFQQRIPAQGEGKAWMDPVTLHVPNHGVVIDIDVYLKITHSEVSDLMIYLESPAGTVITLKDDALWGSLWGGIPRPNMHATIFDDQASRPLIAGEPPYNGRFQPAAGNLLAGFDGEDVFGDWTLRIYDIALADTGTLDRWELHIEHTPEPLSMLYWVSALLGLSRSRRQQGRAAS